ncbi:MAG TPA: hypothetical protein VLK82_27370 [Candidatus Tectomicrobia bacterium]|nr:hypothetical protein [Candidatus Tectomicrobia bacterium]
MPSQYLSWPSLSKWEGLSARAHYAVFANHVKGDTQRVTNGVGNSP